MNWKSLLLAAVISTLGATWAMAASCSKADFVGVVDQAAAVLGALNRKNKPLFQGKLRRLKAKHAWSHDQFLKQAAPFVSDDKIAVFDATSQSELLQIERLGSEGESAARPDCAMLSELQQHMSTLVATQSAKWQYMFQKIEAALAK